MNIRSIWKRISSDIKNYYIAILLFIALNIVVRKVFRAFCPFLIVTGLPCAGCGMTRAGIAMMQLDFYQAIRYNAFSVILIPL